MQETSSLKQGAQKDDIHRINRNKKNDFKEQGRVIAHMAPGLSPSLVYNSLFVLSVESAIFIVAMKEGPAGNSIEHREADRQEIRQRPVVSYQHHSRGKEQYHKEKAIPEGSFIEVFMVKEPALIQIKPGHLLQHPQRQMLAEDLVTFLCVLAVIRTADLIMEA